MKYASQTHVSVPKSKAEIETILTRYGATGFVSGWQKKISCIMFEMNGKRIKFLLPLPDKSEFVMYQKDGGKEAPQHIQDQRYEQALRQRWRALALAIKAKLESVESGITSFEEEFLAHIVLPNGQTIGGWISPQLEEAYRTSTMPPLLGSGK